MTALRIALLRLIAGVVGVFKASGLASVAWAKIGEIQFDAKRYAEAAEAFQRAADLEVEEAEQALDLGNLGHAHYRSGKLDEAAAAYEEALAIRQRLDFTEGIESDLTCYYHVCHYLGRKKDAAAAYGKLMTPPASPIPLTFEIYPVTLDETGNAKDAVEVTGGK